MGNGWENEDLGWWGIRKGCKRSIGRDAKIN